MLDYQNRVLEERNALRDKIDKLSDFLEKDVCKAMDEEDKELLLDQLAHMVRYSTVLSKRILRFKIEEVPKSEFTPDEKNYLEHLVVESIRGNAVLPAGYGILPAAYGVTDIQVLLRKLNPGPCTPRTLKNQDN